jgi:ribosomal protein L40E
MPPQRTGERAIVPQPAAAPAPPVAAAKKSDEAVIERDEEPLAEKPPQRPARATIAMQQASMTFEPEDETSVVKADESAPSLLEGIGPVGGAEKPFAANVVSNNPLSLKSTAPKDVKTLKCRECGAMNDPTEWYCERCGAELSGL